MSEECRHGWHGMGYTLGSWQMCKKNILQLWGCTLGTGWCRHDWRKWNTLSAALVTVGLAVKVNVVKCLRRCSTKMFSVHHHHNWHHRHRRHHHRHHHCYHRRVDRGACHESQCGHRRLCLAIGGTIMHSCIWMVVMMMTVVIMMMMIVVIKLLKGLSGSGKL